MLSIESNDIVVFGAGVMSSVLVLMVGVFISRHLARARREITYVEDIQMLAREKLAYPTELRSLFEQTGVFAYRRYLIAFLNTGTEALRSSDINASDPITVRLDGVGIDEVLIKAQSSRGIGARIETHNDHFTLHFDALGRREGVSIVYFAKERKDPVVTGTLIAGSVKKRDKSSQVMQEISTVLTLMVLFVILAIVDFSDALQTFFGFERFYEVLLLIIVAALGSVAIPWWHFSRRANSVAFGDITSGEGDYYPASVKFTNLVGGGRSSSGDGAKSPAAAASRTPSTASGGGRGVNPFARPPKPEPQFTEPPKPAPIAPAPAPAHASSPALATTTSAAPPAGDGGAASDAGVDKNGAAETAKTKS